MELSALKFVADTTELERASKVIAGLVTDVSKLDKVSKEVAQTEATLAKAAKANADANLQNAKAQDVRLKSTIAADKADQSTEKAVKKSTEATERHTRAVKANADILAYQTDRAKFMAEGFSSGNASTLAQAKALGQLSDELKNILDLQRSFQGNISFDKSDMGIKRLTKSYNEATESQKLFAEGTSLTIEQARELSRDQNRIAASMKFMGKSMDEITAAQRVYANEYNNVASAYNRIDAAEKAVIKQRKEVVSATNYVTQADQRMAAALNVSNVGLDRASSDSLVKYETALRKSGVAQDVLTTKLTTYKTQLSQVQAQEQKRKEQHLARALSPQLTDIGVSLYSGQAPLTVLLQQSGQIVDLFKLSGVEAQNFGKAMRESFYSMVPAISTVAKGMASLVTGMAVDAGSAFTSFIGKITGITAATETMKRAIASGGEENFKYISTIQKMGTAFSALAGAGIFGLITLLGSIAIGLKQVIAQENELNRAVALSGGAMGATADIANTYVARLGEITGNSTKANEAMVAMAKAGNITSSSVMMVGEAAIALNKAMGTPIEETVKQFDKLATAPGKTLIEIAKATGLISAETVELVLQYERAGESAKAAELAQKAYAAATKSAAASVKENYGTLTTFAMGVSTVFSKMWDSILGVGRSDNLDTRIDQLRLRIAENAQATPGLFLTKERIDQDTKDLNMQFYALVQQRQELMNIGKQKEQSVKSTKAIEESERLSLQYSSSIEKSKQEITKLDNQRKQWEKDGLLTEERKLLISKGIAAERKKINDELAKANKGTNKQATKDLETEIDLRNKSLGLLSSFNNELDAIERRRAKTGDEDQYQKSLNDLIAKQPIYISRQKEINDAQDLSNSLLGKADGIGKDYYKTLEKIQENVSSDLYSPEQAEELTRALFNLTPAMKAYNKALDDVEKSSVKFAEASIAAQEAVNKQNADLDYRVSVLGTTTEQEKALSTEYQRSLKLKAVDVRLSKELRDIQVKINEAKKDGLKPEDYASLTQAKIQAEQDAAEEIKAINREIAVQAAEDFDKEFKAIRDGISDSIVTALFEGGKAGSTKLRSVIVNALKKPITMVVNAVVNTIMGSVMGSIGSSLFGSAASSVGGSLLGNMAGGAAGSALGGSFLGGGSFMGMMGNIGAGISTGFSTLFTQGVGAWASQGAGMIGAGSVGGGLGMLAGPIGAILVLAASWDKLFGRTLKDTGIQGTFGGKNGFEGQQYKFYKGGLFRSDKTELSPLEAEMEKAFRDTFIAMRDQTKAFAEALGLDASKIEGFTTSFKLSLKGLSEEEAAAKIQEVFATANNELAQQIIGTWETTTVEVTRQVASTMAEMEAGAAAYRSVTETVEQSTYVASEYAKEGENAIDTLTRLATSLTTVNQTLSYLGVSLFDVGLIGADAASKLVDAFGGLEQFTASTGYFYDNFYSQEEKAVNIRKDLQKEFDKLNLALPDTKEGFRDLVNSFDLTTEEGRKAYATVMKMAPSFVQMIDASSELAQAEQDRLDDALEAYKQQQRDIINAQIDSVNEQVSLWQGIFDFLTDEINKLYGSVTSTAQMQVADARNLISAAASTGNVPDLETLQSAVGAVTGSMVGSNYASKVELEKDKLKFAAQLDDIRDVSGSNLKVAKNTLDALILQLESLDNIGAVSLQQLNGLYSIDNTLYNLGTIIEELPYVMKQIGVGSSSGSVSYSGGSSGGSSGGGGTTGKGYTPSKGRVSYGSNEALESREKFTDWYQGLKWNMQLSSDYEVPDWMRMIMLSSEDEIGLYLFFKNNPDVAADFQRIATGGTSNMPTDGSSLIKSDLDSMPKDVADYFRANPNDLLAYEAFGLDPVLARQMYVSGPEQFGISNRGTNVTQWLQQNRWTPQGVVASDNVQRFNSSSYDKYPNARWNPVDGTLIDLDGTVYSRNGAVIGRATPETMSSVYSGNSNIDIRRRYDGYIGSGYSANDLVTYMQSEGLTIQQVAEAYGVTADEIVENLRAGGATNIPAYANGGSYQGGLALVGEQGPELINFNSGGYVHTASQTRGLLDQSAVVDLLERMNSRIEMVEAAVRTTAISNNKIAKILDRVTPDGNSLQVVTVEGSVVTAL